MSVLYYKVYSLLKDPGYYSLEINYTATLLNVTVGYLRSLVDNSLFHLVTGDSINIFQYNDVTYIGLESRRLDYERDKLTGTNWVEDAIKRESMR